MVKRQESVVVIVGVIVGVLLGGSGRVVAQAVNPSDPGQAAAVTPEPSLEQRVFHVEWSAQPGRSGMKSISGYVYNDYGRAAERGEIQVSDREAAGNAVGKEVQPSGDTVPARRGR